MQAVLRLAPALPSYLQGHFWVAEQMARTQAPPPQLGIAASQTAALLVTAMVKIAAGHDIPYFPMSCPQMLGLRPKASGPRGKREANQGEE